MNPDFYRFDLVAVVTKYIGETEKNLGRVFEEAEDGSGILSFGEANVLFARRSEVNNSRNYLANTELNSTLKRMEAFRSPTVGTNTNL